MPEDIGVLGPGWLLSLEGTSDGDSDTPDLVSIAVDGSSKRKACRELSTKSSITCKTNKKVIENPR